jgi:ATP-dependent Lon protease
VFAVAQRENRDEVEIDNLYTVGTIVRIAQVQRGAGGMQLLIHGEGRGLALNYLEAEGGSLTAGFGRCRRSSRRRG